MTEHTCKLELDPTNNLKQLRSQSGAQTSLLTSNRKRGHAGAVFESSPELRIRTLTRLEEQRRGQEQTRWKVREQCGQRQGWFSETTTQSQTGLAEAPCPHHPRAARPTPGGGAGETQQHATTPPPRARPFPEAGHTGCAVGIRGTKEHQPLPLGLLPACAAINPPTCCPRALVRQWEPLR